MTRHDNMGHQLKGQGVDTKELLVAIQVAVLVAFGLFRWCAASRRDAKNKA